MMDTDDAELALLGDDEQDEAMLRSFLDAVPRDATKRAAAVATAAHSTRTADSRKFGAAR